MDLEYYSDILELKRGGDVQPPKTKKYFRSTKSFNNKKKGLGLGLFIGKTLLEKNFASVNCSNSETRSGAEVVIKWNNKDLFNL